MATNDSGLYDLDDESPRHRGLKLSEPPRRADDDDDDDAQVAAPRRARRRPRVEHVSTPPMMADDLVDSDVPAPRAKKATVKKATTKHSQDKGATKKATTKAKARGGDRLASLPLEITGIVIFALDVLLALSLLSYSSNDGRPGHVVGNWIGPGGAFVADLMTLSLGAVAFFTPFAVLALVVACFRPVARPKHAALRVLAGACATVSAMSLLHLVFRGSQVVPFPAGGLVGAFVADGVSTMLAPLGTGVLAAASLFVGIVIASDVSLGSATRSILDRLTDAWLALTEQVQVWREERRLLAEDQALVDEVESLPAVLPVDEEDLERQRAREEKADARRLRITDKARARADERLALDQHAREQPVTAFVEPARAMPLPMLSAIEDVPIVAIRPQAKAVVVVEPPPLSAHVATFESQATIVQSDPPWAKDIDDGVVLSLADAMEKAKHKREAASANNAVGALPSMIVDDELKIIARDDDAATIVAEAERMDAVEKKKFKREFVLPPLNLLDYDAPKIEPIDPIVLRAQADKLIAKFADFGIDGRIREIRPGPVVTTYEFVPAPGIKVSKIASLSDDIAMAMEAIHVRIVAPIPGKGAVGIEIPNEKRETVYMKEIIADPAFKKREEKLLMALGKDIEGKSYYANLAEMPHVLIAGTTGSGKSVSVNAMICSILYRSTPEDVRFMMIDPKMLELSLYEGIPHLLLPPIIDSKKAAVALKWAVAEMERRYQLMSDLGVRDLKGFNDKVSGADAHDEVDPDGVVKTGVYDKDGKRLEKMPYIVVIIDEYADLIAVAGKDVEAHVMRIAQKARAAGMHVMLATQRPSVDIITGVIKANFPVRMGFRLASNHDSKTIINQVGAEKLLGRGDMLFMPPGTSNVVRVHGAFISEKELHRVVDHLKTQGAPNYNMDILTYQDDEDGEGGSAEDFANEPKDARYDEAIALVARTKKCSTSFVQRMLNIGYQRAARIVDRMEREGLVGPALNTKGDRDIHLHPDGTPDASQRRNF